MSTTYEILRFDRPKKSELKDIDIFSQYDRYRVDGNDEDDCNYYESSYVKLFRLDDPYAANLCNTRFAVPMELPRIETDYEKMYRAMGFSEEAIKTKKVQLTYGNNWHYFYTDGTEKRKIETERMREYDYQIPTQCFAIKMQTIWDSGENYVYPDHDLVLKYLPDIDKFHYVPINNTILSKVEIPFLIFDRNKGKCFIERS